MDSDKNADDARMQQALDFLQANRLAEAQALLAQILQTNRRHWETWHLLGAVHGMLGEFQQAENTRARPSNSNRRRLAPTSTSPMHWWPWKKYPTRYAAIGECYK